ncbi:MAG: hypothetical protein WCV90_07695 [Candidatus Woesearchaeota archaeon]|jgi:hypothetical protein
MPELPRRKDIPAEDLDAILRDFETINGRIAEVLREGRTYLVISCELYTQPQIDRTREVDFRAGNSEFQHLTRSAQTIGAALMGYIYLNSFPEGAPLYLRRLAGDYEEE